jgi:hypothetical protein
VTPAPVVFRSWIGFAKRCYWNGVLGTSVIVLNCGAEAASKASRTRRGSSALKCKNSISSVRDTNVSTIRASGACSRTSTVPQGVDEAGTTTGGGELPLPVASTTHLLVHIPTIGQTAASARSAAAGDSRNDSGETLQLSDPLR